MYEDSRNEKGRLNNVHRYSRNSMQQHTKSMQKLAFLLVERLDLVKLNPLPDTEAVYSDDLGHVAAVRSPGPGQKDREQ